MTSAPTPKPNRTPWIIAGVLGCLVLCIGVAVVGVLGYLALSPTPTTVGVGPGATNTRPPFGLGAATPTSAPQPTPVSASPTRPATVRPTAQPTSPFDIVGVPTQSPAQPAQPATRTATRPPAATATPVPPRGKIAFTVRKGDRPEDQFIWIMNADGTGAKQILERASEPTFSPDGSKIAYYRWTDGIFVANADGSDSKKILGDGNTGFMDWSHDGRWIAFSVRPGGRGNIAIDAVAPDGTGRRHIVIGWSPSWSPDDTQLVFQTCRGPCGIFKSSSGGGEAIPIIGDDGGLADWSPDGKRIVYQKDVDGQKQLFIINADGTGKKQLTSGAAVHVSAAWSPDGHYIYYRSPEGGTWGIWRMTPEGTNPVKLIDNMPPGDWPYERLAVSR